LDLSDEIADTRRQIQDDLLNDITYKMEVRLEVKDAKD